VKSTEGDRVAVVRGRIVRISRDSEPATDAELLGLISAKRFADPADVPRIGSHLGLPILGRGLVSLMDAHELDVRDLHHTLTRLDDLIDAEPTLVQESGDVGR
jgi:hypothetical protein